jgi:hypothetical protein
MQDKETLCVCMSKWFGFGLLFAITWILGGCGSTSTSIPLPQSSSLIISNISVGSATPTTATIIWSTNVGATSQADFGTSTNYGSTTALDSTMVTSHSVTLNGLTANTLYNVRVRSKDSSGTEFFGTNFSFTTPTNTSSNAPQITAVNAAPSLNSASITWLTDKPADQQVEYGTTTAYGQSSALGTTLSTSHSVTLSGLSSGTTYQYRVKSRDSAGNLTTSGGSTFTTNAGTPPVISAVNAVATSSSATITWTTDKGATQQVDYGPTASYGQSSTPGTTLTTSHSVVISGLNPSTTYNYRVRSSDAVSGGNLAVSGNFIFTTQADTTPPLISAISSLPSSTTATITWTTNKTADSQVEYGTTTAYGQTTTLDTQLVMAHSAVLSGLTASTTYNFRVKSRDGSGNLSVSGNFTFQTTASGSGVPLGTGWTQLPNTQLQDDCPANTSQYAFSSNCKNVIAAWSGGIADTARNRLIIWGGGHVDYYGNEVYSLNLSDQTIARLNNPGPVADPNANAHILSDGTPNARHTYDGLAYIAHADRMFAFSGSLASNSGNADSLTWTLNLATLQWQNMNPAGTGPRAAFGVVSEYDPNTQNVFVHDTYDFFQYNYDTNTYTHLSSFGIDYHDTAVIDPGRKLFIMMGGDFHVVSIAPGSNYQDQNWATQSTGCSGLYTSGSPGLAYDPVQKLIVGWAGGDTVYLLNPDTKSCTTMSFPNGPGASQGNGTFGRFRYLPAINAFAVVNDAQENAYVLKF